MDFDLQDLRSEGFDYVFVAVGAQVAKRLQLAGEEAEGVLDALRFLRSVRERVPVSIGRRVGVIGAGDTAMDCARSAYRLGSEVTIIYRRTIDQMPADREEIRSAIEEGIRIVELAIPTALEVRGERLTGVVCDRMEYRGDRDAAGRKVPQRIPQSAIRIPLDTLIVAISQDAMYDFFGDSMPELNERGYLEVDPETLETSVRGVFAGGDAAADGPSSIVKAAADGKRVARNILSRVTVPVTAPARVEDSPDLTDLLIRRARRQWRISPPHTPLDRRRNFEETVLTYTPEQAMAEAGRCLDCHQICSVCVSVCPNLALMTYESEPLVATVPRLRLDEGAVTVVGEVEHRSEQRYQIAVLTDFCNECGNCTTFCPTAGEPYRDKPRLYLHRPDFEAESDNAFMLSRQESRAVIEGRWRGETHRLVVGKELSYESPTLRAKLHPQSFQLIEAEAGEAGRPEQEVDLLACASMYQVLRHLARAMPQIPWAEAPGTTTEATRLGHPGYEE